METLEERLLRQYARWARIRDCRDRLAVLEVRAKAKIATLEEELVTRLSGHRPHPPHP